MRSDIAFNIRKMEELSDQYAKERNMAADVVGQLKKADSLSNSGKGSPYRTLISDFKRYEDFFNNMSRATTKTASDAEYAGIEISRILQNAADKMKSTNRAFQDSISQM